MRKMITNCQIYHGIHSGMVIYNELKTNLKTSQMETFFYKIMDVRIKGKRGCKVNMDMRIL